MPFPDDRGESQHLLNRARAGDEEALGGLLVRHLPDLRAFVRLNLNREMRALESQEDLVQSCCREVLQRLPGVEYRDEASFRNWLFGAVLNKIRDRRKYHFAEKRHPGKVVEHDPQTLSISYAKLISPSAAAMWAEDCERLEQAFDRLSPRHRQALTLRYHVGLDYARIAAAQGGTAAAVKKRIYRAQLELSKLLRGPIAND